MRWTGLIVGLLLAACQATDGGRAVVKRGATPHPAVEATVKPTPTPRPTQPPDTLPLRGVVAIEASYVISNNGGSLVSNNGGNVLAVGNALVSDHGGGIISDHGGGLIGKVKYRLAATVEVGTLVPVAGMEVGVRSLSSGEALPVMRTADGSPVFTTTTDDTGAYLTYLPEAERGNVLVEAHVPGSQDPRLRYTTLTSSGKEHEQPVDEDSAALAVFIRHSARQRLVELLTARGPEGVGAIITEKWDVPDEVRETMRALFQELRDEAARAGIDQATPEAVEKVAEGAADAVLAQIDLAELQLDPAIFPAWKGPREPALPALQATLARIRTLAAVKLRGNPRYFDNQPYLIEANQGGQQFQILRAADLSAFIQDAYLASNSAESFNNTRRVYATIGDVVDPATGFDEVDRMEAAIDAVIQAFGVVLLGDVGGAKERAIARIRAMSSR